VLEDPSRDEWQKPHDVVMALNLKRDEPLLISTLAPDILRAVSRTTRARSTQLTMSRQAMA
jgi:hypothetical protein